jgi:diamine N-acetyltransferase
MSASQVKVRLKPVDRDNWRAMVRLNLRPGQEHFVSPPSWSLSRAYARGYGDRYEYLPMVICDADTVVGYVTLVCDASTVDDYWIDDIMIDAIYQGRGYGRAAMKLVLAMIPQRYPGCGAIKLTCFRGNDNAAALYQSLGFEMTGELDEIFKEPIYALAVKR